MSAQCYPAKVGFFGQAETNYTGPGRQPSPPVSIHAALGICLALGEGEADAASASFGVRVNTKKITCFSVLQLREAPCPSAQARQEEKTQGCLIQVIGRIKFALLNISL